MEAITREEKLLDGQDLEPITRKEVFIKRIYDKTQYIPEPITREEHFLKKAGESGGDITIEQLTVTENGEYSEQGVAYSPVIVEVPTSPSYVAMDVPNLPQPIASFNDGQNEPLRKLKISIEPTQSGSGDPSPSNIRPISGWDGANVNVSGANLWDEEWEEGILDTSTGANLPTSNRLRSKNYIACKPNTAYYFYSGGSNGKLRVCYYDANKTYLNSYINGVPFNASYTTPNNCYYLRFCQVEADVTTYGNNLSINYPSTATTYAPYNGNTYPISWSDEAETVYGGNFKLFKDGGKWYCTVTKVSEGYVFTKDDEWEYTSGNRFKCNKACGFNVSGDGYNYVTSTTSNFKYEYVYTSSILSDNCMTWFASTDNLFIRADGYADLTSFKAFLQSNPITIVGELATPETYTFEIDTEIATLLGVNNIFADCGDVEECRYITEII